MNTRKYPRSLTEAFGPYASGPIQEPKERIHHADKVVLVVSGSAFGGLVLMALAGWFA